MSSATHRQISIYISFCDFIGEEIAEDFFAWSRAEMRKEIKRLRRKADKAMANK